MVKTLLLKSIVIGNLILISIGCSKSIERDPPETASGALNEFVASARFQYINLDELDTQNILLDRVDIIYNIINDGGLHIGQLTEVTKIADRFYIYDSIGNSIFEIDMNGTVIGPLTREGSGPGEHGIIWNLKSNSRYIYADDPMNARTNIYITEMDFVEQKGNLSFLDLNDELILTGNHFSRGITPVNPNQGRLVIRFLDDLADTLSTIMPRIIPAGYEPQIYNSTRVSLNRHNIIAANYFFLPWFFLFDEEFNHTQTLILQYSVFEEMDIPPMDYFKNLTNEGFGGSSPVTEYKLMDNGDIFFSIRRELFHLSRSDDGTWQAVGKYRFNHDAEEEPLWISDIFPSDKENEFYVGSWYYLFRFNLSK